MANAQSDTTTFFADTISATTAFSDGTFAEPPKLSLNGYIQTDNRLLLDGVKLHRQEYRLDVKMEYKPFEKTRFYGEVWLRGYKYPEITQLNDLSEKKRILNFDSDIREAYFDIYGLFTKNLDIRVGRQRIAWGTADRLNPTDNLNPYDMEDIWDFGRHLGSNAIKLTYYLKSFTFTGVVIPWFTPSVLPDKSWNAAFNTEYKIPGLIFDSTSIPGIKIPVYLQPGSISDTIILPEKSLKHTPAFGIKIKKSIGNFDISASYTYAHDALPIPKKMYSHLILDTLILSPELKAEGRVSAKAHLEYPVIKVIGLDFAGSVKGVGIWGEAACFLPEKIMMKRYLKYSIPDYSITVDSVLTDSLILDNKPYLKFILGFDYNFKHGFYLNFQYLHGFINERGSKELNDYFLISLQWKNQRDNLQLNLLQGGVQISDFKNLRNNYAWFYTPEIIYKPVDNAEIILGAHLLDGTPGTSFGKVTKNDEVFLKFRYTF